MEGFISIFKNYEIIPYIVKALNDGKEKSWKNSSEDFQQWVAIEFKSLRKTIMNIYNIFC